MQWPTRRWKTQKVGVNRDGSPKMTKCNERRYWATWECSDGNHVSVWWEPDGTRTKVYWNATDGVTKKESAGKSKRKS